MNDIVRIGVVGAGSISVRGIMPHLVQDDVHDRVQMTAVCDPVPGRAPFGGRQARPDAGRSCARPPPTDGC